MDATGLAQVGKSLYLVPGLVSGYQKPVSGYQEPASGYQEPVSGYQKPQEHARVPYPGEGYS